MKVKPNITTRAHETHQPRLDYVYIFKSNRVTSTSNIQSRPTASLSSDPAVITQGDRANNEDPLVP